MCRLFFPVSCVLAALTVLMACGPRPLPAPPTGLTLQPGRYVMQSYFAPNFKPDEMAWTFNAFTVASTSTAPVEAFLQLFQEELVRAWQAQGLKVGLDRDACRLSGTVHHFSVKGARLRWLTGRLHAALIISGTVTRGEQVLFAFQDQVKVSSPLAPGPAAAKEKDLLLRQLARETVYHLLNELLLHGPIDESG